MPVLSTHFGAPDITLMRVLKANGTRVIATATTVGESRQLASAGVDAIIAQGSEAGGHRGTFAAPAGQAEIGTMALVPQIADGVSVPVIAAGGIMDGRGIAAALILGASGVQMGTAFVPCPETGVSSCLRTEAARRGARRCGSHRRRHREAGPPAAKQAGQSARAEPCPSPRISRTALDDFGNLRQVASAKDDTEYLPMWAVQGVQLTRAMPAAELVGSLVAEAQTLLSHEHTQQH